MLTFASAVAKIAIKCGCLRVVANVEEENINLAVSKMRSNFNLVLVRRPRVSLANVESAKPLVFFIIEDKEEDKGCYIKPFNKLLEGNILARLIRSAIEISKLTKFLATRLIVKNLALLLLKDKPNTTRKALPCG